MNVRYWFPLGTAAEISRTGGPFEPFMTDKALIFKQPAAETGCRQHFGAYFEMLATTILLVESYSKLHGLAQKPASAVSKIRGALLLQCATARRCRAAILGPAGHA